MKIQKNIVVSKDVAQWLRNMGHDEYCDCYLHTDNDEQDDYEMGKYQHCNSELPDRAERIEAPYVSDALTWLMQNKGIILNVTTIPNTESETKFDYAVMLTNSHGTCGWIDTDYQMALYNALNELMAVSVKS